MARCLRREMDFLNVPGRFLYMDAAVHNSPSGLSADFSGHPCPETADNGRNIKEITFPSAMTAFPCCLLPARIRTGAPLT